MKKVHREGKEEAMLKNKKRSIIVIAMVLAILVPIGYAVRELRQAEHLQSVEGVCEKNNFFKTTSKHKLQEETAETLLIAEGKIPMPAEQKVFLKRDAAFEESQGYIENDGNLYAVTENGEAVLVKWNKSPITVEGKRTITVPESVEGLPVVSAARDAFILFEVETVRLPASLRQISAGIFDRSYIEEEHYALEEVSLSKETKITEEYIGKKEEYSGRFGYRMAEKSEDGMVIINGYLLKCVSEENVLVIPEGVEIIAQDALHGCTAKDVILPESVKEIYSIPLNVKEMNIPTGVMRIVLNEEERRAPWFLEKTERAEGGMVIINGILLYSGSDAEEINIPNGVWSISGAFRGKENLKRAILSDGITEIGKDAFADCEKLQEVVLPDSIIEIGERAFKNCKEMKNITLKRGIEKIDREAFYGCTSLECIVLPKGIKKIKEESFSHCPNLRKVLLPQGVLAIETAAFWYDSSLEEINLPEGLQYIDSNAFEYCIALEEINIPDSVEYIGAYAFADCRGVRYIRLGNGVKFIGDSVFHAYTPIYVWNPKREDYELEGEYPEAVEKSYITEEVIIELPKKLPQYMQYERFFEEPDAGWFFGMFGLGFEDRKNTVFIVYPGSPAEKVIKKYRSKDDKEMYQYRYYE